MAAQTISNGQQITSKIKEEQSFPGCHWLAIDASQTTLLAIYVLHQQLIITRVH